MSNANKGCTSTPLPMHFHIFLQYFFMYWITVSVFDSQKFCWLSFTEMVINSLKPVLWLNWTLVKEERWIIILRALLTTFELSIIFEATAAVWKFDSSLKSNLHSSYASPKKFLMIIMIREIINYENNYRKIVSLL